MNGVLLSRIRLLCSLAPMALLAGNDGCEPTASSPEPEPGCYCPAVYDPVCGSDGKTYGNACEAACVDVKVVYEGECRDDGSMLCLSDDECKQGESCDHSECLSPCQPGEVCPAVCYGQCLPSGGQCEPVLCKIGCEHGFAIGEDGCEICECAPPPSPSYCLADDACKDGQYCDHSECLSACGPDEVCPAVCYGQCLPRKVTCEPVLCELYCKHGFATNEDGCEICQCAPPPEPVYCLVDDACGIGEACDHSECLSPCGPGQVCPAVCYGQCLPKEVACEPVLCKIGCEYGFAKDENGCEICACAPAPETPSYCLSDEACEKGEYCDHTECLSPCAADETCIAVCYGQCLPGKPASKE